MLRIRQSKLDKGRAGGGGGGGRGGSAGITLEELRADFPLSTMSDAVLQNRLRERCGCQPRGVCRAAETHILWHMVSQSPFVSPSQMVKTDGPYARGPQFESQRFASAFLDLWGYWVLVLDEVNAPMHWARVVLILLDS